MIYVFEVLTEPNTFDIYSIMELENEYNKRFNGYIKGYKNQRKS